VAPGAKVRIPFQLSDTDIDVTVIMLDDIPAVRMWLETPHGDLIDPATATGFGGLFSRSSQASYYRLNLPVPLGTGAHGGLWHAVLELDGADFKKWLASQDHERDRIAVARAAAHGARYSLVVQTSSNLRMEARVHQSSLEPGATMTLRATLTEYGVPVQGRARVRAEVERPDATTATIGLAEVEPGVFEAAMVAAQAGLDRFRVVGWGKTFRDQPFTREQALTGAVWPGGDTPPPSSATDPAGPAERLCQLISCLLGDRQIAHHLKERGIEAKHLAEHLAHCCKELGTGGEHHGGKGHKKA
jgi:hypothetical protein